MANDLQVAKVEVSAWVDPTDFLEVSKVEVSAWVDPLDYLQIGKVEVSAWVDYALEGGEDRHKQILDGFS